MVRELFRTFATFQTCLLSHWSLPLIASNLWKMLRKSLDSVLKFVIFLLLVIHDERFHKKLFWILPLWQKLQYDSAYTRTRYKRNGHIATLENGQIKNSFFNKILNLPKTCLSLKSFKKFKLEPAKISGVSTFNPPVILITNNWSYRKSHVCVHLSISLSRPTSMPRSLGPSLWETTPVEMAPSTPVPWYDFYYIPAAVQRRNLQKYL
jgi:hypothetical protein